MKTKLTLRTLALPALLLSTLISQPSTCCAQVAATLAIQSLGDSNYLITWTDSSFVLEEASSLTAANNWQLSPRTPTLLSNLYSVSLSSTGASRFFRLRSDLPPDPATVAPPVDPSVATSISAATEFLYTGTNAIQTGVTNGTIDAKRAAILRGKIKKRDNTPLAGVVVSILDHPGFGSTVSRADGMFDLAVNGGGPLTVDYQATGFCPVQRQVHVPWQDYVTAADVVMIQMDPIVTTVALGNSPVMQMHQGSVQTDADGARRATLLFTPGTAASLVLANGTTQAVSSLNIRATEFTVGTNGPATMPGVLPPTSAYTYCVELSADEAMALGATIQFDRPVFNYVENFIGFPVGMAVPVGFYDRKKAVWVPSLNGRVIKILSITGGFADVDTDGDGNADTGEGLTNGERQQLATLYAADQTLWRVPITHFTPFDCNWPQVAPPDATRPNQPPPKTDENIDDGLVQNCGSIIEAQNQILGESIGIVGTPFTLNYRTDRVPGRAVARTVTVPVSGATVPDSLVRIEVEMEVGGQVLRQTLAAARNQTAIFTWDGLDAYGRSVQGRQPFSGTIGYVYGSVYADPANFRAAFAIFGTTPLFANTARQEITLRQPFSGTVGAMDARGLGMGGWSPSVHHSYDLTGRTLFLGNGQRVRGRSVLNGIETVAGNASVAGFNGDGGPATQARLNFVYGVAVAPDGSLFIVDGNNHRIRRVGPDRIITTVAGIGTSGFSGDGGLATDAALSFPRGVAVGPDGSFYVADFFNHRVRRVGRDGIITTVAGNGNQSTGGDGGPATQAAISQPSGVAVAPDGSLFITDVTAGGFASRIRRVGPDGIITTAAGTGPSGFSGDGGPAIQARIASPFGVAVTADGSLYIADSSNHRIRRVGPDGIITTVAGIGSQSTGGDGGPATQAGLANPTGVAVAPDGSFYIADFINSRVRRVGPDGIITTVAGNGVAGFSGDGGPALQAAFKFPGGIALAPDGSLYIPDRDNHRIRRVAPALPGSAGTDILLPSEDGDLLYRFDGLGRHRQTLNALTGATLFEFGYDAGGRLTQVIQETGDTDNVTTIQHDANGNPTAIVSPYGQTTTLGVDANGFLSRIINPAAETNLIAYTSDGLLTSFTDARGKTATYEYDDLGRLFIASDSCCGTQIYARTNFASSNVVTRTTAVGRVTTYAVENLPTGDQRLVNIFPDGTKSTLELRHDGTWFGSKADGTVSSALLGPDPRFGMQSPITASFTHLFPSTLQFTASRSRSAVLANSADPLSLASLTETSTVDGRTATNIYTAATRTIIGKTPSGRTQTATIDAFGRLVQGQFSNLDPVLVGFDSRSRLQSITNGSGLNARSVALTYNAQGFLDTVTDSIGRTAHLEYDAAGRVTSKTLPGGRLVSLGYDAAGNLTSVTPPGRPAYTLGYSDRNELTLFSPPAVPGSGPTAIAYDTDGAVTNISRAGVQTISINYDAAGRPVTRKLTAGGGPTTTDTFSYDSAGRTTNVLAASGVNFTSTYDGSLPMGVSWSGPVAGSVARTYDHSLRLASQSVNGASTIAFSYDDDGLLTGAGDLVIVRDPQNGLPTGTTLGVTTSSRMFNGVWEMTNYTVSANASTFYSSSYARNGIGRIAQKLETIGGVSDTFDYAYDTAGQLTNVARNGTTIETYAYDTNGNRTNATVGGVSVNATYDDQDRLTQSGTATFIYNGAGDLVSKTDGAQTTTYDYDPLGNLLGVSLPDGSAITYLVDGLNRRVGRKVNGTLTQGFLYQGRLRPVAELDAANNVVSRFVYAIRDNVPDLMMKGADTFRIITDHLGSPRLVVNVATGAIVQRLDYDEFGRVLTDTNPGFQPFGFAGGLYDPATKLLRFGARDHDPETGRWTAQDSLGFAGGDHNLYRYCLNDPVNLKDSTGLAWEIPTSLLLKVSWPTETGMSLVPDTAEPEKEQSLVRRPAERPDRGPAPPAPDQCFEGRIVPVDPGMLFPELMKTLADLLGGQVIPPAGPVMGGPRG